MASPASLLSLPPELKAVIVSLVAQQDDRFRARVAQSPELALPVTPVRAGREPPPGTAGDSLLMLSLVNKELRTFAAPHLFKELKSSQMGDRIVQFSILANYPFAFQTVHFDCVKASEAPLLESTLAVAHTLTNLTSLTIATEAADVLFYDDESTFDDLILGALRKLSTCVVRLEISGDGAISEALLIKLLECLPNLTHLALLNGALDDSRQAALAAAVDSLADLRELRLDLDGSGGYLAVGSDWSQHPWKLPLRRLEIRAQELGTFEWDFINAFSNSLECLVIQTDGNEGDVELDLEGSEQDCRFPRLAMLSLNGWQGEDAPADLNDILRYLSHSPLVTLHYKDGSLHSLHSTQGFIELLQTNLAHLRFLDINLEALDPPDLLFLQNLTFRRNITVLRNPPPAVFRDASVAATIVDDPNSRTVALEALKRAVAFGRASIERAEMEEDVKALKRLLALLAPLEDERLRWVD